MTGRVLVVVLVAANALSMQSLLWAQNHGVSIALRGSLTTASRVFTDPNSSDAFRRSQSFALEDFLGYGVEVRYQLPETNVALGLSADYIETTIGHSIPLSTSKAVPVENGYRVIPIELTGYFIIPFSGQTFGVYMGGGVGGYFGRRVYRLGETAAPTTDAGLGFGIHVLGGLSYRFTEWFSLGAEMKFRDLQFQTTNQFAASSAMYQGMPITVSRAPFDARIHTDGVIFQLGTVFSL
jgi:opacity protein-like surface antigen